MATLPTEYKKIVVLRLLEVGKMADNAVVWKKVTEELKDTMKGFSFHDLKEIGKKAGDWRVWEVIAELTSAT